jgi:hypothetical protein
MRAQQVGISVVGAVAGVGTVLAGATVWLFLTEPVTVVNAVNDGQISPFVRDLARVILEALRGLPKYF